MPVFERNEFRTGVNRKWIYLLIIVAFGGFYLSKCSKSNARKYFKITNATLSEQNSVSIDVTFEIQSMVKIDMEKNFEISVFTNKGEFLVGNKLTRIKISALQKKRYRKVVNFLRPIHADEVVDSVRVEFYDKIQ